MKRGYIIGAGAQGRVVLECWRAQHPDAQLFFVDDNPKLKGRSILDTPVICGLDELLTLGLSESEVVLAIGHNPRRLELAAWLDEHSIPVGCVVHPGATVMPSASVGVGSVVFAGARIITGASVGKHVIVNTGAVVEHDCILEDGCLVGSGVCMGGRVTIGRGAFISAGVTLAPRVCIGAGTVIGAGAVVVANICSNVLAYGVPARVIRSLDTSFDWGRLL